MNAECRVKGLQRCQEILRCFPSECSIQRVWFTDEKAFTVATPVNSPWFASDSISAETSWFQLVFQRWAKRDLYSWARCKINSKYYCNNLLEHNFLRDKCGHHNWILQQDGAPSHTAVNTVVFLKNENVQFIEPKAWPPNSPDINPGDYAVWGLCSSAFIFDASLNLSTSWNKPWHWNGDECHNASSTKVSLNVNNVYGQLWTTMELILNICSNNYVFTSSF